MVSLHQYCSLSSTSAAEVSLLGGQVVILAKPENIQEDGHEHRSRAQESVPGQANSLPKWAESANFAHGPVKQDLASASTSDLVAMIQYYMSPEQRHNPEFCTALNSSLSSMPPEKMAALISREIVQPIVDALEDCNDHGFRLQSVLLLSICGI